MKFFQDLFLVKIRASDLGWSVRRRNLTMLIAVSICLVAIIVELTDAIANPDSFPDAMALGILLFMFTGLLSIIFIFLNQIAIAKVIVSIFPVATLQIYHMTSGLVINEFYFWYPYAVVAASIIPQIVYDFKSEKGWSLFCLSFYLIYLIMIDDLLIMYATDRVTILEVVKDNIVFYNLVPLVCFLFINSSVYYLKLLNRRYEDGLTESNMALQKSIESLEASYEELYAQRDTIEQRNMRIEELNSLLNSKIDTISQDLLEKNEQLTEYAFRNSHVIRGPIARMLGLFNLLEFEEIKEPEKRLIEQKIKHAAFELDEEVKSINRRLEET